MFSAGNKAIELASDDPILYHNMGVMYQVIVQSSCYNVIFHFKNNRVAAHDPDVDFVLENLCVWF